jgi:hypothetical protein
MLSLQYWEERSRQMRIAIKKSRSMITIGIVNG